MSDFYLPLIKSVIAKLKATSAVTSLVSTRIYTDVPQAETFPYIVVSADATDFSTKTDVGQRYSVQFDIYDREKSPQPNGAIRAAVFNTLNRLDGNLLLDAGKVVSVNFQTSAMFKEPDGVTWHGALILDVITMES